jgi:Holliday junction resolvase RusA-like endonuclease
MKIILNGENPPSLNDYLGKHYRVRKAESDRIRWIIKEALPTDCPQFKACTILFSAYFKKSGRDADNIICKYYIDALKGLLFPDDNINVVRMVSMQGFMDKKNPRLEIEVKEIL